MNTTKPRLFVVEVDGQVITSVPWTSPLDDPKHGQVNKKLLRAILLKEPYILKTGNVRGRTNWAITTEFATSPLHKLLTMLGKSASDFKKNPRVALFLGYKPLVAVNLDTNLRWELNYIITQIEKTMKDSLTWDPQNMGKRTYDGTNLKFRTNFSRRSDTNHWDVWYQQMPAGLLVKELIDHSDPKSGYKQVFFYPMGQLAPACQQLGIVKTT